MRISEIILQDRSIPGLFQIFRIFSDFENYFRLSGFLRFSEIIIQGVRDYLELRTPRDFSTTWSASDQPIFPYNSGTKAWIEAPQTPEDGAR